ncbi:ricin-like [Mercurialis annua]|uniref:ricin-like n=1 Tax=Mercurialis annua TaxID=3986 RepID=UPI00215EE417|nr:ricin-like [Mercurialis annua]
MKGNKTVTLWIYTVTAMWLCWTSSRWCCVCALPPNEDALTFNLRSGKSETFRTFVEQLRGRLRKNGHETIHDIPILKPASSLQGSERFVIVQLKSWQETSVELAIDVSNVNIVGYCGGDGGRSYFLSCAPGEALSNVFQGSDQRKLAFGGSYRGLEATAGIERKYSISLGSSDLHHAIDSLYNMDSTPQADLAKHLLVITQMICDSARFNIIEVRVSQSIDGADLLSDETMVILEDNWESLSRAIQESTDGGVFSAAILLWTMYGIRRLVGNMAELRNNLALMQFVYGSTGYAGEKSEIIYKGSMVEISSCSSASSAQRWVFPNDGSIMNLDYGLVLDVKGSDPSLIIWQSHEHANQKWLIWIDKLSFCEYHLQYYLNITLNNILCKACPANFLSLIQRIKKKLDISYSVLSVL